jgi:hypothetical protein
MGEFYLKKNMRRMKVWGYIGKMGKVCFFPKQR